MYSSSAHTYTYAVHLTYLVSQYHIMCTYIAGLALNQSLVNAQYFLVHMWETYLNVLLEFPDLELSWVSQYSAYVYR